MRDVRRVLVLMFVIIFVGIFIRKSDAVFHPPPMFIEYSNPLEYRPHIIVESSGYTASFYMLILINSFSGTEWDPEMKEFVRDSEGALLGGPIAPWWSPSDLPPPYKKYYYKVEISQQPADMILDEEILNKIIEGAPYFHKVYYGGSPTEEKFYEDYSKWYQENILKVRSYVENELKRYYPTFMEAIKGRILETKAIFKEAVSEVFGIDDRRELSPEELKAYIDFYIENIKDGDLGLMETYNYITVYQKGLKDAVADFVKQATGEDFNLFNSQHAGLLSYWADFAYSAAYGRPEVTPEMAIGKVIPMLEARKAILSEIKENIFNSHKMNVFDPSVGRLMSYFADKKMFKKLTDAQVKEDIKAFGDKLATDKQALNTAVANLIGDAIDTEEEDRVLTEFSVLVLKHLLAEFDEEAMEKFKEANKGDPGLVWQTLLDRRYTAVKATILIKNVSLVKTVEDFFTGERHDKALAYAKQKASDMLEINNAFQEKFGKKYDVLKREGLDGLFSWGFMVDEFYRDYEDQVKAGEMTEIEAHNQALSEVLGIIGGLTSFPEIKEKAGAPNLISAAGFFQTNSANTGVNVPIEPGLKDFGFGGFLW